MIKVCFFAELRERLNCAELVIEDFTGESPTQLMQHICTHNPGWSNIFSDTKLLVSINHAMAKSSTLIIDGDEVAFFPPVTGG